jgi:hypothetical protein
MEELNINNILNRQELSLNIKNILTDFENNKNNLLIKRGIYLYGEHGIGKTTFIKNILKELNYDVIIYDAGDMRNTSIIEEITKHNMSDKNIMSLLKKKVQKIALIMDEIDGMNNGDKGGINTLIKIIRPKKTKKQKIEEITSNPIICIGNNKSDKKIKELMKVCHTIKLDKPKDSEINIIIKKLFTTIDDNIHNKLKNYINGDLRKLNNIYNLYKNKPNFFNKTILENIFQIKSYNDDTKNIIFKLLNNYYNFNEHNNYINETDRTSIGLLMHENIIDIIEKIDINISLEYYIEYLNNLCFGDYIDRITFQKQIWQFNEMSSLIKTFKNNKLLHDKINNNKLFAKNINFPKEIRFTKVLTKYSTEYNNLLFIHKLTQKLGMDKKDLYAFFYYLKITYPDNEIYNLLENFEINKLEINRIYRYIEKYIKENASGINDIEINENDIYENTDINE